MLRGQGLSLLVAVGATVLGGVIRVALGLISGYAGGVVDAVIMRCMDGVMAFPFYPAVHYPYDGTGDGIFNVILAIGIAVCTALSRVVRGQVLIVKRRSTAMQAGSSAFPIPGCCFTIYCPIQ